MVPFAGWEMPVEYSGITDEHLAVRTRRGVFDVSHMGEIEIAGKDALAAVQRITSNDASRLADRPGPVLRPDHARRHLRRRYPRVPDGRRISCWSSTPRTSPRTSRGSRARRRRRRRGRRELEQPLRARRLQGPAREVLQTADRVDLAAIKLLLVRDRRGRRRPRRRSRAPATRARTASRSSWRRHAERLWDALLQRASPPGSCRAGSARATRCASKRRCALYGNDIDETTTCSRPTSAGSCRGPRATSSAATCSSARRPPAGAGGSSASRWSIAASPATAIPWSSTASRRRRRHERHADAVPKEGHRPRLRPAATPVRRASRSTSAAAAPGARRPAAVLQAPQEVGPCIRHSASTRRTTSGFSVAKANGTIGITDYAQQQLGDVVYVELPEVGATLKAGQVFGTIESVKAVSELFAPCRARSSRSTTRSRTCRSGQHRAARRLDDQGQLANPRSRRADRRAAYDAPGRK